MRHHVRQQMGPSGSRAVGHLRRLAARGARTPQLEALEARLCLAAHIWSGAASNLWSNPVNWSTGGSPAGDTAAVLTFPLGAANLANQNDLTGIKVAQLKLVGSGYTITGNAITLNAGGSIVASATNTFNPNIALSGGNVSIQADGKLTLGGIVSGAGSIEKTGTGTLVLGGTNSFTGSTLVSQGTLNVRNAKALGLANSTVVVDGATLEIQGGITIAGESLSLGFADANGAGTAATLRNVGTSANTWTGSIDLASNANFDVTGTLLVSGVVKGADSAEFQGGDLLTKSGAGTLEFSNSNTYTAFTEVASGKLRIRNGNALGSTEAGTRVDPGATLALVEAPIGGGETVSVLVGNESLELGSTGGTGTATLESEAGNNSWTGPITLTLPSALLVDNGGLDLRGPVAGPAGLTKSGPGNLLFSGSANNTYTGTTQVSGGTLFVNKTLTGTATSVSNQATLAGNGTTKGVTLRGGILSPGNLNTAILRAQGNVVMDAASRFDVLISGTTAGTNYDQLLVSGRIDLAGAQLLASMSVPTAVGTTFTIVNNTGTSPIFNTFAGLPQGTSFTLSTPSIPAGQLVQISYQGGDGNDVVLTRINAPPMFPKRSITAEVGEGGLAVLTGEISDPDLLDAFKLDVDWGDGKREVFVFHDRTGGVRITHRYLDDSAVPDGRATVHLIWSDPHGGSNSGDLSVKVVNRPPTLGSLNQVGQVAEGQPGRFRVAARDPGSDPVSLRIDWGDGTAIERVTVPPGAGLAELEHRYATGGSYQTQISADDGDGGTAESNQIVRVAYSSNDRKLIGSTFQQLLGRNPTNAELSFWSSRLANGVPASALSAALARTPEARGRAISQLYESYLHREPTQAELLGALRRGTRLSVLVIASSDEYYQTNGGTPAKFVAALYQDLLGRAPSEDEITQQLRLLNSGATRAAVVRRLARIRR